MDDEQRELLKTMWIDCSIDLARWARAFLQEDDHASAELLRQLQQRMLDCAQQGHTEPF